MPINFIEEMNRKKQILLYCCIGIFIGIFIKLFILDFYRIQGTSMEPTYKTGDRVAVFKLSYGITLPFYDRIIIGWSEPQVDDIVVCRLNSRMIVKRCTALAGTPLDYSAKKGYTLIVDGKEIPLTEEQFHKMNGSFVVPEGYVLLVGDNAEASIDSRNYGFINTKNIIGRVIKK